jgi:hypothetical protein
VKALADFLPTLQWIEYPGTGLPRWLMTQMLSVAAGKHSDPLAVCVLPEADHN